MTTDETSIPTPTGRVTVAAALLALAQQLGDGDWHPVKIAAFARSVRRIPQTAHHILRKLVAMGLVEREAPNARAIRYRLTSLDGRQKKAPVPLVETPKKPKRKKAA